MNKALPDRRSTLQSQRELRRRRCRLAQERFEYHRYRGNLGRTAVLSDGFFVVPAEAMTGCRRYRRCSRTTSKSRPGLQWFHPCQKHDREVLRCNLANKQSQTLVRSSLFATLGHESQSSPVLKQLR